MQVGPGPGEAKCALDRAADDTALAIKEEKCNNADQRRKQDRGRRNCPQGAPAAKFIMMKQERERHANSARQNNARSGNEEAIAECLAP